MGVPVVETGYDVVVVRVVESGFVLAALVVTAPLSSSGTGPTGSMIAA